MITELTKKQESKIKTYLKKGESIGYRTKTIDRKKATKAVNFLYEKIMKIDKPKYVIFLDSPMACQLACNLLKNTKFDSSRLRSQLYSQLGSQLGSQLNSQLGSQLNSQLNSQIDSQLYSQLRSQLNSQIDSQLNSQLNSQLYSQLNSQIDSQLNSQLYSQLRSQLNSQIDSQLRSQLRSQLNSQLGSQLNSQQMEYFYQSFDNWYWTGHHTFYDYVLNELMPEKKKNFKLFAEFLDHKDELHLTYMFPQIVFVSDFPKHIRTNNSYQLHNYGKPALEYRDTYALHYSNGVNMPKELIETSADKITKEMFLSQTNVDVRREVSRKLGMPKTIEMLGAETIDTYKSKVGGKYQLILIDFDNRGNKRPYLRMQNPSMKNVEHIEGVGPGINTVKDAIMWRNQLTKFVEPKELT